MSNSITVEEWLAEIERCYQATDDSDAYTLLEWCDRTGKSRGTMLRIIHSGIKQQRIQHCRVKRTLINGVIQALDAYRFVPQSKEKAKRK